MEIFYFKREFVCMCVDYIYRCDRHVITSVNMCMHVLCKQCSWTPFSVLILLFLTLTTINTTINKYQKIIFKNLLVLVFTHACMIIKITLDPFLHWNTKTQSWKFSNVSTQTIAVYVLIGKLDACCIAFQVCVYSAILKRIHVIARYS